MEGQDPRSPQQRHRGDAGPPVERAFSMRVLGDGTMKLEWASDAFVDEFELDIEQPTQLGVFGLADERDVVIAADALERLESGAEVVEELRLVTREGMSRWYRMYARPVRDVASGKLRGVHGGVQEVTASKIAEIRLRRSLELLRRTEEERLHLVARLAAAGPANRFGVAPADDPSGTFSVVSRRLSVLARELDHPRRTEELRQVSTMLEQAVERLRHLVLELRPPELEGEGLAAAVWASLEQARAEAGFGYRLENRLQREPDEQTRMLLFRILQEALANVRKHARAEHLEVLMDNREQGVFARVWDDGLGFTREELQRPGPIRRGLSTMRERAELGGGWCRVDSLPALGTRVEFWLPLPPDEPVGAEVADAAEVAGTSNA